MYHNIFKVLFTHTLNFTGAADGDESLYQD